MNVLGDTNVISELKRGHKADRNVVDWIAAMQTDQIFTSVVVLGEIRRGIEQIARRDKPQGQGLERWYTSIRERLGDRVLPVDETVMTIWARISVPNMLPAYDGLIAATAIAYDLTLVTRDKLDYRRTGLRVIDPWST